MNSNFVENLRNQSVKIDYYRKKAFYSNFIKLVDFEKNLCFQLTCNQYKDFFSSLIDQEDIDLDSFISFVNLIYGRFFK